MTPPPDAGFAQLKALLIRRTGHHYYADKDELLWERVLRRLQVLGLPGTGAYLLRLADPVLGEPEWAALEAEITIGETFFFRYAEQFAALRTTILPELLERRRHSRRLRIWSAGCANGAEPYSIAILLRQLLGEALPEWHITLLGTDLNVAALAQARAATFSAWSLRAVPAEERARDFLPLPGGRDWQLQPRHRQMVRFERHNLMDLLAPPSAGAPDPGLRGFDLILCRNVLIYFHASVVLGVVRGLAGRLAEGGWLLLGHAEPSPAFSGFLHPVSLPGTAAWRQGGAAAQAATADIPQARAAGTAYPGAAWQPLLWAPQPAPPANPATPQAGWKQKGLIVAEAPPAMPPAAGSALERARQYANLGDFDGASAACREGLTAGPGDAPLHFYEAMVAGARGQLPAAEHAFRQAIALRPGFAMAHYQLGLLLLAAGQRQPGRQALATAARVAHGLPDDAVLEEGDGMTAHDLREAARLRLEMPGQAEAPRRPEAPPPPATPEGA